jgi:hypothetical protein
MMIQELVAGSFFFFLITLISIRLSISERQVGLHLGE